MTTWANLGSQKTHGPTRANMGSHVLTKAQIEQHVLTCSHKIENYQYNLAKISNMLMT